MKMKKSMAKIEMLITITGLQSTLSSTKQQQDTFDMIEIQQQQQQQQYSLQQLLSLGNLKVRDHSRSIDLIFFPLHSTVLEPE